MSISIGHTYIHTKRERERNKTFIKPWARKASRDANIISKTYQTLAHTVFATLCIEFLEFQ